MFVLVPQLCTMIRVSVIIGLLKSHCDQFAYHFEVKFETQYLTNRN